MPEQRLLVYWDSCVFLDYVNGAIDKLPTLDALLDRAGPRGDIEIVTSTLSIAEVAIGRLDQTGRLLDPEVEANIDQLWTDPIVKQVELYKGIALRARDLVRASRLAGGGLKPADAIHLATARQVGVSDFHTYDTRLFQYSQQMGFPVREPVTDQPRLDGL